MKFYLFINGLDGPMMRQVGCDCNRCQDNLPVANTSASLVVTDDNQQTVFHVLIDAGANVADAVARNPLLHGRNARIDWLLLTHWHPDHALGINPLCSSYLRNCQRHGKPADKVKTWCRSGSAEWVRRVHFYEEDNFLDIHESFENNRPGTLLTPIPHAVPELTITPITLSHFNADISALDRRQAVYACAGFIIEAGGSKIGLLWDMDTENDWLLTPTNETEKAAVAKLKHADHLFLDTAYWNRKAKRMSHAGFENICDYVDKLSPKQTWLVHLSGHPDEPGNKGWGWTNAEWRAAAQFHWRDNQLPGTVDVPSIGQRIELAR